MGVQKELFGTDKEGKEVYLYTLSNSRGMKAKVMNYGAILVDLIVPDKEGKTADVVLGYDKLSEYFVNGCFFGAVIGPNANRIANARFILDGVEYHLDPNDGMNNLHSHKELGVHKRIWEAQEIENGVVFSVDMPDADLGFPGNKTLKVTYSVNEENELKLEYSGISDKNTIINMTNHSYFNLSGEGSGNVLDQEVCIHAKYFTPVKDSQSIPTGEYVSVEGTPMDFNVSKPIGRDIEADFEQLKLTGGYDHNYVTDNYAKGNVRAIACAYCKESGIGMEVSSDCPCVQFYAGNFIIDEKGKKGHVYHQRDGFCLETQVEPNAVNVEDFHSPILRPGEEYSSETIYRFFVK